MAYLYHFDLNYNSDEDSDYVPDSDNDSETNSDEEYQKIVQSKSKKSKNVVQKQVQPQVHGRLVRIRKVPVRFQA